MKTLDEYIEYYEKHTGEAFKFNNEFSFFYSPKHGFCEYKIGENGLLIWQMCGDLKHWIGIAYDVCQKFHLPKIGSYVVRNPIAFARALGFKVRETEMDNGKPLYRCENAKGEILTAYPDNDRYIFVWVVKFNDV